MTTTEYRRVKTEAEVASIFGVSTRTVRRRIRDGSIRAVRLGGAVRIPDEEVERILNP